MQVKGIEKVEGIENITRLQVDANLDLMVTTLEELFKTLPHYSIDRKKTYDSLEKSREAHRQLGMPSGEFALFFPNGYLGLAVATYNRIAGDVMVDDIYTDAMNRVSSPGDIESGVIVRNPKLAPDVEDTLWHTGLPFNSEANSLYHNSSYLTTQEKEAETTIAELERRYPDCTARLVGTTEIVVQAITAVLSDGEVRMPLNRGFMSDPDITRDEYPLVGSVFSSGVRLYLGRSSGRACGVGGVSFGVTKKD